MAEDRPDDADRVTPARGSWRRPGYRPLLLLVAAWLVTVLAYVAHATVVLPPLIVIITASLLRGGRSLLDRIMLAISLLLGATCVFGLVFAVWPWGLHPIPIAGCALTGLLGFAVLTGRRPTLPRPRVADALAFGAGLVASALVAWPLVATDQTRRLAFTIGGEDLGRHIALFDAIRRSGGFLFQHWNAAVVDVYQGMVTYPQGSHFLFALLDGFLRASPHQYGSGLDAMDHYLGYMALGYGFFTLAMVWAAQWIAASAMTTGRRMVLAAFVAAACLATDLLSLVGYGYPSEIAGIAEFVLLVALLARPVPRLVQHLVVVASLLVTIGFTYYLFLPPAMLAIAAALLLHRDQVRRHPKVVALVMSVGVLLASGPIALGLTVGHQTDALFARGNVRPSRDFLLALGCVVAAGLLARPALRSAAWRSYAASLVSVGALFVALVGAQRLLGSGGNGYYANKTLHLATAVLLVGVGALARYLPVPTRPGGSRWRRIGSLVPGALAALAVAAGFGLVRGDSPYRPMANTTWAQVWLSGTLSNQPSAESVMYILSHYDSPRLPTMVLTGQGHDDYTRTMFLATLERTGGTVSRALYGIPVALVSPERPEMAAVAIGRTPFRIVAESDMAYEMALDIQRRHPELDIDIVRSAQ